jgi:dCTP deaminase
MKRLGGDILIRPFSEDQLNPNSYNLRLAQDFIRYRPSDTLDLRKPADGEHFVLREDEPYLLKPGELLLGQTLEYTETHNLIPQIDGRSSTARLGLCIHQTGGFGDIGYCGTWTLEISCIVPIWIYPLAQIAQLSYHLPCGKIDRLYKGKYQGSQTTRTSELHVEAPQSRV